MIEKLWVRVDGFYEYRESMVNDLMNNNLEKGMTYKQMTDLIGEPEILLI